MTLVNSPRLNLLVAVGLTAGVFYFGSHPSTAGILSPTGHTWLHVASFALIALFYGRGLPRLHLLFVALLVTLIGAALELYQLTSPGHYAEWDDILANGAGAICGALLSRFLVIPL